MHATTIKEPSRCSPGIWQTTATAAAVVALAKAASGGKGREPPPPMRETLFGDDDDDDDGGLAVASSSLDVFCILSLPLRHDGFSFPKTVATGKRQCAAVCVC